MKFKTEQIKEDYNNVAHDNEGTQLLKWYLELLDRISQMTGHDHITITDYLRDDINSLHHYRRAADIRCKDKNVNWYIGMVKIGEALAILDMHKRKDKSRFKMQPHFWMYRKDHQHLHVEIRLKA